MFDGTLVKLIKFPAEHLTILHRTLVFRGTPVENHCATHTDFVNHIDKLMSNDLSLLHCNIRSLYKNMDNLEEIVTPCSKSPDVIALSETRIKETSIIATLPGYNFINENSQTQAGSVGAYIKNNLKYLQRSDLQFKMHGCENIWLEILGKRQKIIIGIVYTPSI